MNSLQDLNSYSRTSLDIIDNRASKVNFSRQFPLQPLNDVRTITSITNQITTAGNDIIEIINYATANIRFRVSIKTGSSPQLTGSTITFDTLPTGLTLTSASDVYTITGISTVAQWNTVKQFTWTIPSNYASCPLWYLEVAVIYYDSARGKDVTVIWYVYDPRFFYISKMDSVVTVTAQATKIRQIVVLLSSQSTLTISLSKIQNMSANLSSASTVYCLPFKNVINLESRSTLSITPKYQFRPRPALISNFNIVAYNTTYIDVPTNVESYSLNTQANITGGPIITDALRDGTGAYTMTVVPSPTGAVSQISSLGRYAITQTISAANGAYGYVASTCFSGDEQQMFIGNPRYEFTSTAIGYILYYKKGSNNQWSATSQIQPGAYNSSSNPNGIFNTLGSYFASHVAVSYDGQTLVASAPYEHLSNNPSSSSANYQAGALYVYTKSGNNWVFQARLTVSGNNAQLSTTGGGDTLKITADGNKIICVHNFNNPNSYGKISTWTRSSSTWTLVNTLTDPNSRYSGLFGQKISLSADGNSMVVDDPRYYTTGNGPRTRTYVYTWSGSSWGQLQTYTGISTTDNISSLLSSDGLSLIICMNRNGYSATATFYSRTSSSGMFSSYQTITDTTNNLYLYDISYDGNSFTSPEYIWRKKDGVWIRTTAIPNAYYVLNASPSLTWFINYNSTNYIITVYQQGLNGTSYNTSTKTLTLTGTRDEINGDLNTIKLTPTTNYNSNFLLTYTVNTPRGKTDSRDQNVNFTA
jgi:hypothetical protein